MHMTSLRKVGGSVMLAVPPTILELLQLRVGSSVGIDVSDGRLVVDPRPRLRYSLTELLSQCDAGIDGDAEDAAWLDAPAAGRELL